MKKRLFELSCIGSLLVLMVIMSQAWFTGAGAATTAPTAAPQANPPASMDSQKACLDCHGPFDKLATASPGYLAPSGEKINPHRFVPHDSKDAKAIPGCTNCHQAHPLPPTAAALAAIPKPDVEWCYTCHHKNNFTNCAQCHNK
ncbi:MAG TPA: cytochrome c3 family protein [Syntrophorhabdaceae bacterium]|nr:cytochrome c3 family protein [Syntrophorhabdaceae bacterium]